MSNKREPWPSPRSGPSGDQIIVITSASLGEVGVVLAKLGIICHQGCPQFSFPQNAARYFHENECELLFSSQTESLWALLALTSWTL